MRMMILCVFALLFFAPASYADDAEPQPVKPVLIVMDVQNQYIPMMDEDDQKNALRMINGAIWLFRERGLPIIRVYHTDPKWGPDPESEDFQFPEEIIVTDDDPMIVKNHPSAFAQTELDGMLKEMDVNAVFLSGLSATGCVLATYFGAQEREYNVFMIKGAVLSQDSEKTEMIIGLLSSVDWFGLNLIADAAAAAK